MPLTGEAKREYDAARYLARRSQRPAKVDPITLLSDPQLAYLAGLTDGDGSIYATSTNQHQTRYPVVMWAMTHRPTIDAVRRMVSGTAVVDHNTSARRRNPGYRVQWRTSLTGARAVLLCERMAPFMLTKVEQARLVATWPADARLGRRNGLTDEVRQHRLDLAAELGRLNAQ